MAAEPSGGKAHIAFERDIQPTGNDHFNAGEGGQFWVFPWLIRFLSACICVYLRLNRPSIWGDLIGVHPRPQCT
jgi:hypothetical protein